jgi:hypothetical protein
VSLRPVRRNSFSCDAGVELVAQHPIACELRGWPRRLRSPQAVTCCSNCCFVNRPVAYSSKARRTSGARSGSGIRLLPNMRGAFMYPSGARHTQRPSSSAAFMPRSIGHAATLTWRTLNRWIGSSLSASLTARGMQRRFLPSQPSTSRLKARSRSSRCAIMPPNLPCEHRHGPLRAAESGRHSVAMRWHGSGSGAA